MGTDSSVEPSSTAITSQLDACASALVMEPSSQRAALKQGMRMETSGSTTTDGGIAVRTPSRGRLDGVECGGQRMRRAVAVGELERLDEFHDVQAEFGTEAAWTLP